jgi:hypothetical protein
VFLTETKTVMLRFLRLTRANHQTIPQAYCLIACAFTPPLALFTSLLKKSLILIHFASFSLVVAPCGCPVLDADAHSPRWCHAPTPPPLTRAPSCAPPAPSCRSVGVGGARATRSANPSPVLVAVVVVVLDASGACDPPLVAGSHSDVCCKYMF